MTLYLINQYVLNNFLEILNIPIKLYIEYSVLKFVFFLIQKHILSIEVIEV